MPRRRLLRARVVRRTPERRLRAVAMRQRARPRARAASRARRSVDARPSERRRARAITTDVETRPKGDLSLAATCRATWQTFIHTSLVQATGTRPSLPSRPWRQRYSARLRRSVTRAHRRSTAMLANDALQPVAAAGASRNTVGIGTRALLGTMRNRRSRVFASCVGSLRSMRSSTRASLL